MEEVLQNLANLQFIDSRIDEIARLRGDLPEEILDIETDISRLEAKINKLDEDQKNLKKEEDDLTPIERENYSLDDLRKTWMADSKHQSVFISAREKTNINELRKVVYEAVKKIHIKRYPYNSFLYEMPE